MFRRQILFAFPPRSAYFPSRIRRFPGSQDDVFRDISGCVLVTPGRVEIGREAGHKSVSLVE
jgi:hypothetical protein